MKEQLSLFEHLLPDPVRLTLLARFHSSTWGWAIHKSQLDILLEQGISPHATFCYCGVSPEGERIVRRAFIEYHGRDMTEGYAEETILVFVSHRHAWENGCIYPNTVKWSKPFGEVTQP
jgi:hypothetical protein